MYQLRYIRKCDSTGSTIVSDKITVFCVLFVYVTATKLSPKSVNWRRRCIHFIILIYIYIHSNRQTICEVSFLRCLCYIIVLHIDVWVHTCCLVCVCLLWWHALAVTRHNKCLNIATQCRLTIPTFRMLDNIMAEYVAYLT